MSVGTIRFSLKKSWLVSVPYVRDVRWDIPAGPREHHPEGGFSPLRKGCPLGQKDPEEGVLVVTGFSPLRKGCPLGHC